MTTLPGAFLPGTRRLPYWKLPSIDVGTPLFLNWRRSSKTRLPFLPPRRSVQAVEELRPPRLVAAALAEELVLERVQRVDVVAGERRRVGTRLHLVPVVDAVDVGVDVGEDLLALLALRLQRLRLLGDDVLGLLARDEALELGDEADRAEPGGVDRGDAGVVARLLEQQAAVLGGDPAGGEDAVVVGVGRDVRDAVDVAEDRDARDGREPSRSCPARRCRGCSAPRT